MHRFKSVMQFANGRFVQGIQFGWSIDGNLSDTVINRYDYVFEVHGFLFLVLLGVAVPSIRYRKRNGKCSSDSEFGFKSNSSFIIFNDIFDNSESESHSAIFGGKFRFKNMLDIVGFDSGSVVFNRNQHI